MDDSEEIRVLQLSEGSNNFGGVSSFLYNVYSNIDRTKVQFDFISPNCKSINIHREEIKNMGGGIYELKISGNVLTRKINLYINLKRFLLKHKYNIIHINSGNFFFNLFSVKAAENAGVKHLIVHSHNAGNTSNTILKRKLLNILKPFLEKSATDLYACSQNAAAYMFTKNACRQGLVTIVKNGINIDKFDYKVAVRLKVRHSIQADDKFIIGHIGRFEEQKNHKFLVKCFYEIHKMNKNTILLLCGTGTLEKQIKELVKSMHLEDCVYFMGFINNVEEIYQALDVLVMPSHHEGAPISCVEAQISGLPCVLSDTITKEIKICDCVEFLSLDESPRAWAQVILSMANIKRKSEKQAALDAGYSISEVSEKLQEKYINMLAKTY